MQGLKLLFWGETAGWSAGSRPASFRFPGVGKFFATNSEKHIYGTRFKLTG